MKEDKIQGMWKAFKRWSFLKRTNLLLSEIQGAGDGVGNVRENKGDS